MKLKGCFSVLVAVFGLFTIVAGVVALAKPDWTMAIVLIALGAGALVAALKL